VHPKLGELIFADEQWFFTMEYAAAVTDELPIAPGGRPTAHETG